MLSELFSSSILASFIFVSSTRTHISTNPLSCFSTKLLHLSALQPWPNFFVDQLDLCPIYAKLNQTSIFNCSSRSRLRGFMMKEKAEINSYQSTWIKNIVERDYSSLYHKLCWHYYEMFKSDGASRARITTAQCLNPFRRAFFFLSATAPHSIT